MHLKPTATEADNYGLYPKKAIVKTNCALKWSSFNRRCAQHNTTLRCHTARRRANTTVTISMCKRFKWCSDRVICKS